MKQSHAFWCLNLLLISGLIFMVTACGSESATANLEQLETKYRELTGPNSKATQQDIQGVMSELAGAYEAFATNNPDNPQAPEYLYKAAELFEPMGNIEKAMTIFDNIISKYPDSEKAPDALFKKGYVYHNTIKDLTQAKTLFMQFLERYPEHELAASAKFEIENLGVPAKDLLEKIQGKTDSTATTEPSSGT